jgi:Ca2+-binding EF-hand superfamily protein
MMKFIRTLPAAGAVALMLAAALSASVASAQTRPAAAQPAAPSRPSGQPANSPDQVFAAWDVDRNKALSIDEFKTGWEAMRESTMIHRLQEQFASIDRNKNGAIEAAEYASLPAIRNSGATAPPLSAFDSNKNLSLDFKEFLGFVEAMIKNAKPAKNK